MSNIQIKINIYGNHAAGKTRFLYELIDQLREKSKGKEKGAVRFNKSARKFYTKVNKRVDEYGVASIATDWADKCSDITLTIRNDFFSPDGTGRLLIQSKPPQQMIEFTFPEVVGEDMRKMLDGAIDGLDNLVRDCSFLLYFFDPTCSIHRTESDNNTAFTAAIRNHYDDEIQRAETLIQKAAKLRPTKPLPILFIETHQDILENLSEDDSEWKTQAKDWFDKLHKVLTDVYSREYGKDANGNIRTVDPAIYRHGNIFMQISAEKEDEVFIPLRKIGKIQHDASIDIMAPVPFWEWFKKVIFNPKAIGMAIAGILVIAVLIAWLLIAGGTDKYIESVNAAVTKLDEITSSEKITPVMLDEKLLPDAFSLLEFPKELKEPNEKQKEANQNLRQSLNKSVRRIADECIADADSKVELALYLQPDKLPDAAKEKLDKETREKVEEAIFVEPPKPKGSDFAVEYANDYSEKLKAISAEKLTQATLDENPQLLREVMELYPIPIPWGTRAEETQKITETNDNLLKSIQAFVACIAKVCDDATYPPKLREEFALYLNILHKDDKNKLGEETKKKVEDAVPRAWDALAERAKDDLKKVFASIRKTKSLTPLDDVKKVKACLVALNKDCLELRQVVPLPEQCTLITEINQVIDFCDEVIKRKGYMVTEVKTTGEIKGDKKQISYVIDIANQLDRKIMRGLAVWPDSRAIKDTKPPQKVIYLLPLENPVFSIADYNPKEKTRSGIKNVAATIQSEPSLASLGMALLCKGNSTVVINDQSVKIETIFSHAYVLPVWFWDAL